MSIQKQSLAQGFHDLSPEEYFAYDAASQSLLKEFKKSPQHALSWKNNPKEPTPQMVLGSAFHAGCIEAPELYRRYVAAPVCDKRTKAGKELWEQFIAQHGTKTVLSTDDFETVERMVESVYSHPVACELLKGGQPEMSLIWNNAQTGAHCKARIDYLRLANRMIVDLKSTDDASPEAFQRSAYNFGYHTQGAFYLDGVNTVIQDGAVDSFVIIAVEKKPPYAVAVYYLDDLAIDTGRSTYLRALTKYVECITSDKWPGYSNELQPLSLPRWAN